MSSYLKAMNWYKIELDWVIKILIWAVNYRRICTKASMCRSDHFDYLVGLKRSSRKKFHQLNIKLFNRKLWPFPHWEPPRTFLVVVLRNRKRKKQSFFDNRLETICEILVVKNQWFRAFGRLAQVGIIASDKDFFEIFKVKIINFCCL